jgi:PIN domain nuclease of toxin-antitoxin system
LRLKLDTHTLLWWLTDDPKLPARVAEWIEDPASEIAISPISAYELRFKALKGLFPGGDVLAADLPRVAAQAGFAIANVTIAHAIVAGALPLPHRDPFDRLLAAQAKIEGFAMLSIDAAFDGLGVSRVR